MRSMTNVDRHIYVRALHKAAESALFYSDQETYKALSSKIEALLKEMETPDSVVSPFLDRVNKTAS